ncbi:MAG: dinitrogenase iron-molybdenum cofactor biosynthesis protein [Anaerolineaceae bacterium]|nr:dinitrogenase iron-molybdenum cofactor biosynthesis protein [Anaerolineaceae bacterium]
MKIAMVSDDGKTISRHFGRATYYLVFTIENNEITGTEQREKPGHQHHGHHHQHDNEIHLHEGGHGMDARSVDTHNQMLDPVQDCAVVIAGGMGMGAYRSIEQANMRPFITTFRDAEEAARAYIAGTLVDHPEKLH